MSLILLLLLCQKVDQARVDEAVARAVKHLTPRLGTNAQELELVLLALAHGGVPPGEPAYDAALRRALRQDLAMTYRVALLAMTLEEIERVHYQPQLARCAQFLLDNQGENGLWSYGKPTTYPPGMDLPASDSGEEAGTVVVFEEPRPGAKPTPKKKIKVDQRRLLPPHGDNSNAQYAALGLRACHDAGIVLPAEAIQRAADWWRFAQGDDGGWAYVRGGRSYGSMTAGALGARAILLHIQGRDWRRDPVLKAGVEWLTLNFSVAENPGHQERHHLYYLYGLERAGMICDLPKLGPHAWYALGAKQLLGAQKLDGSWGPPTDTAFAILFLKRATRSMVESGR